MTVFTITQVKKKTNFRHLWDLRLADTETQATRSHRRIESSALVLWCIKKTKPGHCGKSHFLSDLYPDLGKKTNFGHFRGAILSDLVRVRTFVNSFKFVFCLNESINRS